MLGHAGPTHRGAPFVGRHRELGLLVRLLHAGLEGGTGLLRVVGPPGQGRRRLVAEALNQGPDVEWLQLAPDGEHLDVPRWARTELWDLLETYPRSPVPSWALHVLARWSPHLAKRARTPALSREVLDTDDRDTVTGAAVAAVILALTGETAVIADLGLLPEEGGRRNTALALGRRLAHPGALAVAADRDPQGLDPAGILSVKLDPLRGADLDTLVAQWLGTPAPEFARYLLRSTGGRPLFVHETVRWLEELGHVGIDDERRHLELEGPVARLPLLLRAEQVLTARYQRLPAPAARLLRRLARDPGVDIELLRDRWNGGDAEFDEALATLRRREFLLHRHRRRPPTLSTPLWNRAVFETGPQHPRRRGDREPRTTPAKPEPRGPLARARRTLTAVNAGKEPAAALVPWLRQARQRRGPNWDAFWGRAAVTRARAAWRDQRPDAAMRWVRRGLDRLETDRHPGLRRNLMEVAATVAGRQGDVATRDRWIARAAAEARCAGHTVAATRLALRSVEAERRALSIDADDALELVAARLESLGLDRDHRLAERLRLVTRAERHLDLLAHPMRYADRPRAEDDAERTELARALEDEVDLGWGLAPDRESNAYHAAWRRIRDGVPPADRPESVEPVARHDLAARVAESAVYALAGTLDSPETRASAEAWLQRLGELRLPPARLRNTARALARTPAVMLAAFRTHFRAALAPATNGNGHTPVTFHWLGRVRLEQGGDVWPRGLWPRWWDQLWRETVLRRLEHRPWDRDELQTWIARMDDVPRRGLEELIRTANEYLTGSEAIHAGIHLRGERVDVEWSGVGLDLSRWLEEEAPPEGALLPGVEDIRLEPWRQRAAARYATWIDRLEQLEDPAEEALAGLEAGGPGADARARIARLLTRRGHPRLGCAIERGSP